MANLFQVSEMAALALHAMALMAGSPGELLQVRPMAARLRASDATLAKVLDRLRRARLIRTARGPKGGSTLARPAEKISLYQVYEAVDGPVRINRCMFNRPVCGRRSCVLGSFLGDVNERVVDRLKQTKLSDFVLRMG
ncbi:Rrf2 family transcriptional regulator [candidate division WOR-3 bacterium]|nr:Rrf2 family transcriptional regulator [candidate division WOR-3 bacterium]